LPYPAQFQSRTRLPFAHDAFYLLSRSILLSASADWINSFLLRFWKIYEPVLSATIVASVDQVLSTSTPGFLESIKMTTFTLGSKAPRIDSVRTFPKTPDDVVLLDWKISFTPTDLSDVTPRDQKFQTNPFVPFHDASRLASDPSSSR